MQIKHLQSSLLFLFLALSPALLDANNLFSQNPSQEEEEHDGPLPEAMNGLKDHMRALRKSLSNPERKAESTEHAQAMMQYALEAMKYCPPAPEGFSPTEVVKWKVDFQRKLLSVCDHMLQIELALAEGRIQDAQNLYRAVADIKKEGHETYDPEDEEEAEGHHH